MLQQLGRAEEADAYAQLAVEMYRRIHPGDHPATATALECLPDTRELLGRTGEAESLQRESVAMLERMYDDDHAAVLRNKGLLASTLLNTKQFDRSILSFEEVAHEQERVLGPLLLEGVRGLLEREAKIPPLGKPRVGEALERLVQLYESTGNTTEAAAWRTKLESTRAENESSTADDER